MWHPRAERGPGALKADALEMWLKLIDEAGTQFRFEHHAGPEAVEAIWLATVRGEVTPDRGVTASLLGD